MYLSHSSGVLLQPLRCFAPTTDYHQPPTLLPRSICGVRSMSSWTKCSEAPSSSISINYNEESSMSSSTSKLIFIVAPPIQEGQPECITRGHAIVNALEKMHLTAKFRSPEIIQLQNFKTATREDVAAIHDRGSVYLLEATSRMREKRGSIPRDGIGSMYATSLTFEGALVNVGAGLSLVDYVAASSKVNKNPPVGFALTRPDGHMVFPEMGTPGCAFCNIAIAARYAQQVHGLRRVSIIDFDVYHGSGTCETFYDDPDVFYLSTHHDGIFPVKKEFNDIGCGNGEGATLNMPLPEGSGDIAMRAVFDQVIVPCAQRFKPDIILVSAGYNGHVLDPLRKFQFTTGTYYMLASGIKQLAEDLCGGRCVFFLEGGSNLEALSNSVAESFRALIGDSSGAAELDDLGLLHDEPSFKVKQAIQKVKHLRTL